MTIALSLSLSLSLSVSISIYLSLSFSSPPTSFISFCRSQIKRGTTLLLSMTQCITREIEREIAVNRQAVQSYMYTQHGIHQSFFMHAGIK
jgi:hypothetical protein